MESPALHEAVAQAAAERGNRITARRLGYALRRWHGRIGAGLRLQRAAAHNAANVVAWKVVQVDPVIGDHGDGFGSSTKICRAELTLFRVRLKPSP